jgi:hypothetical protein
MGRSSPTYRDTLRALAERWRRYRRGLRRTDQTRFDRLFEYAREHADAAGHLNHSEPLFPMLLGIDLEQERRLDAIEARLDAIEQQDRTRVDTGAGTRTERENRQG